jgi:hypothetical protein
LIAIQPVTQRNALVFKTVRLRALQDSPHAFGSAYAKESQFSDSELLVHHLLPQLVLIAQKYRVGASKCLKKHAWGPWFVAQGC